MEYKHTKDDERIITNTNIVHLDRCPGETLMYTPKCLLPPSKLEDLSIKHFLCIKYICGSLDFR